jgi:hypothetical protein
VTCFEPSDRVVVLSIEAVTPVPALGLPFEITGGHWVAHAPEQVLIEEVSFLKR